MALYLIEVATGALRRADVDAVVARVDAVVAADGGSLVESQVTGDLKRAFTIVEHGEGAAGRIGDALAGTPVEVEDVAEVRLVGADLDEVRAAASAAPGYLVEWDLPEGLTMDAYLARKREKSPRYAQVPEVAFRRTYVREDLDKCLCFYDAPCADDVYRAREVVEAPVDRFHELA